MIMMITLTHYMHNTLLYNYYRIHESAEVDCVIFSFYLFCDIFCVNLNIVHESSFCN